MSPNPIKQQAGRRGGLTTARKYGSDYMREIGRRGAESFHARYTLEPYHTNDFLIVERATGRIVATLSGAALPHHPGKD